MRSRWLVPLAVVAMFLAACSEDQGVLEPPTDVDPSLGPVPSLSVGAVYVMSNAPAGNEVVVFDRAADGTLTPAGSYATGGYGTGGGLGNQGGVTQYGRWLFTVNAASNDISSFIILPNGLKLVDRVASGGQMPVSVTVHRNLLYVLNAGGSGNISGFRVSPLGKLTPLAGSTQPLGSSAADPAQILFSPNGRILAVTEKATNTISTYVVGATGLASGPNTQASANATPFGFDFSRRGFMLVTEAAGGAAGASTVSSYDVDGLGNLNVVTGALATTQTAACWLVAGRFRPLAFTANTPNASISALRIHRDGSVSLLDAQAALTGAGSDPLDLTLSSDDHFLYVRNGAGNVGAYRVNLGGSLTHLGDFGSLPAGANGIAAR
jgi:6-phosphogluconolactonase